LFVGNFEKWNVSCNRFFFFQDALQFYFYFLVILIRYHERKNRLMFSCLVKLLIMGFTKIEPMFSSTSCKPLFHKSPQPQALH
jgi:hypothetical protein